MKKNMLVIKASGAVDIVPNEGLESIQAAVGGWIEAVDIGNGATLYCNEEGKLNGLPPNFIATRLFDAAHGSGIDIICGDTVVVGVKNANGEIDGDDYDPPIELVKQVREIADLLKPRCGIDF